jgi:uncharacterized membrane protein
MMGLKDIVSGADLGLWPSLALALFCAAFVAIVIWTLTRPREQIERWRRQPLAKD